MFKTTIKRTVQSTLAALLLLTLSVASAAAHSQVVTPNGNGTGPEPGPISKAWAQAHCNAASPAHIADSSNGVVQFLPAAALPCPEVENPGGQVHPHAGD